MNRLLMGLTVDMVMFLALSSDEAVDPDAATKMLEWIGYNLHQLSPDERRELIAFSMERAQEA